MFPPKRSKCIQLATKPSTKLECRIICRWRGNPKPHSPEHQFTCVTIQFAKKSHFTLNLRLASTAMYDGSTWASFWLVRIVHGSSTGTQKGGVPTWMATTKSVPWFGSHLWDEAEEATTLLKQIEADPLSVAKVSRRQERRYRKATNPKRHPSTEATSVDSKGVKEEIKEEPDSSSSDSDYVPPASQSETEDSFSGSPSSSSSSGDEPPPSKKSKSPKCAEIIQEKYRSGASYIPAAPVCQGGGHSPSWAAYPRIHCRSAPVLGSNPVPKIVATRDQPSNGSVSCQCLWWRADIPPEEDEDMPELEQTPPRPFPKRFKEDPA